MGSASRSPKRYHWSKRGFSGGPGPFALQAAIAAVHCQAARAEDTDWPQIVRLYELLERVQPSPIVSLKPGRGCRDGRRACSWPRAD